jgi:hypothetical protein
VDGGGGGGSTTSSRTINAGAAAGVERRQLELKGVVGGY